MGLLSDALEKSILDIMSAAKSNLMVIECKLTSSNDESFSVTINKIDALDIVQDFTGSYSDFIEIEFDLTPTQYKEVIKNYQGLRCTVIIKSTDKDVLTPDELLLSFEHKIIFSEKQNLFRNESEANLVPTDKRGETEDHHSKRIPVIAQLIDAKLYDMRKKQINFMLRGQTVNGALHFLASQFGLKKVHIVSPDNKTVYKNFIVPPMMNFSNVFNHIQNKYGVYANGFSYYYTDEVLYIYPSYVTDITSPSTIHIYQCGKGHWSGNDGYHVYRDTDLHLVSNTGAVNDELIDKQLENVGSSFIIQHGDNIMDNWRSVDESGFSIPDTGIKVVGIDTTEGMTEGTHHPQFKFSATNEYVHLSELAAVAISPLEVGWKHAVPFSIKPGWKLIYHFDGEDGVYTINQATCLSVSYSIRPTNGLTEDIYTCSANIKLLVGEDQ